MEIPASQMSTCLPLSWRLRRATLVAPPFGLNGPLQDRWEQRIAQEQDFLRYHGVTMTRQLRDELGQGLTMVWLSGMRSVVADLVWLKSRPPGMNNDWWKMGSYINLCTRAATARARLLGHGRLGISLERLDPTLYDKTQPNELRRIKASRFGSIKGLENLSAGNRK